LIIPIIIPYYKKRKRLKRCLKHLKAQTIYDQLDIHIENDSRLSSGYTVTVNRGLKKYLARPNEWDYIVILDQDMYLDCDAIEQLKMTLEKIPECGVAVCLQRLYDRPSFVQAGGLDCIPAGTVTIAHLSYFLNDYPAWWGDIACCMIRKECMWDIGLLDENFGFVCSDSDYTLTARSKGWGVWMSGMARGIHQKGNSAHEQLQAKIDKNNKVPSWLEKQMAKDQSFFKAKWENSDYYKILKYEEGKAKTVIRRGEIVRLDGKPTLLERKNESKHEKRSCNVFSK